MVLHNKIAYITDIVGERGKQKLSKPQHYPKNIVFLFCKSFCYRMNRFG